MADLSFLDKLTPEQAAVANMVADKAIAMGVDPRLAVSLAYQESGFKVDARGGKGEIGVMQVMPSTGKGIGFSEKDLADPAKNIDAGLTYLKQQLDRFPDPLDAVAAYNAGPNHPYFSDPTKKELPESTVNYVKSIYSLGGFSSTPGFGEAKEPAPEEKKPVEVSDQDFEMDKTRLAVDALAAATGAVAGTAGGVGRAAVNRMFPPQAPQAPGGMTAGEKWARATGYGMGQGTVRDVAERFKAAQPQPIGSGKITSTLKAVPGTVAPLSIHAVPPQVPQPPAPSMASRAGQAAMGAANLSTRFPLSTAAGALSGLGAAELGMQTMQRYKQGDPTGAAIAGAGALGSAASLVPHPLTRVIGGGLAMASPAALYVLDKMRQQRQMPQGQMSSVVAP